VYEILRDVISPFGAFREGDKGEDGRGVSLKRVPKALIEDWLKRGLIAKSKLPDLASV